jgi:NAD(P) transhydrogenase subunit alpha
MVKIAVLKETAQGETRVSASPETVKKFIALGATISIEKGAGAGASIGDSDYETAGASVGSLASVLKDADIVRSDHVREV